MMCTVKRLKFGFAARPLPAVELEEAAEKAKAALAEASSEEEEEVQYVEAGVPLLPWNIVVTWPPPGNLLLSDLFRSDIDRALDTAVPCSVSFSASLRDGLKADGHPLVSSRF